MPASWTVVHVVPDDMPWPNVTCRHRRRQDGAPAAAAYGITSASPTNFLISPEGKIVAKDLRGEGIKEKLAELVK